MPKKMPTVEGRFSYDREEKSVRFEPPISVPVEPEGSGLEATVDEIRARGFEPIIESEVTYSVDPTHGRHESTAQFFRDDMCTVRPVFDPDTGKRVGFAIERDEPVTRRPKPVEVIDDFCRRLRAGMTTVEDADWIETEWAASLGRVQLVSEAVPEALVDVLVVIPCDQGETGWSFDTGFRRRDGTWLLTGAEIAIHPVAWMHLPPIPRWLVDLMEQPIQTDERTRELTRSLMAGIGGAHSDSEGGSDANDNG